MRYYKEGEHGQVNLNQQQPFAGVSVKITPKNSGALPATVLEATFVL